MLRLKRFVDCFHHWLGLVLGWCTLLMVAVTCLLVGMRYILQGGNLVFVQEVVIYLHATIFMLGAAWGLHTNQHVRVDVFYRRWSARKRAWIDALGALIFLLPTACFFLLVSTNFVARSWAMGETSPEPGGIPALFLLKSLIPAMALLLTFQGLVEVAKAACQLLNDDEEPAAGD